MRTHQLKTTQISEEALIWLRSKYEAVDSMDAEAYRTFLSEDCELQSGNNAIVKGNNEVIGGQKHFWDAYLYVSCRPLQDFLAYFKIDRPAAKTPNRYR